MVALNRLLLLRLVLVLLCDLPWHFPCLFCVCVCACPGCKRLHVPAFLWHEPLFMLLGGRLFCC